MTGILRKKKQKLLDEQTKLKDDTSTLKPQDQFKEKIRECFNEMKGAQSQEHKAERKRNGTIVFARNGLYDP